jgi:hypothetical protein
MRYTAAVDAPKRRQHEQGGVYQQLLVSVAVVTRGVLQAEQGSRVHLQRQACVGDSFILKAQDEGADGG